MDPRTIEFSLASPGNYPAPAPAVREMPEWLKRMPGEMDLPGEAKPGLTIKRCPPFLEAVSLGYLIPAPCDFLFQVDAQGALSVQSSGLQVTAMPRHLYANAPFASHHVIVFPNPWLVRTAPGYSTLFHAPLNRADVPFRMLTQVFVTDARPTAVSVPALCLMRPGQQFRLSASTPLLQAVPIRREQWDHRIGAGDTAEFNAQENLLRTRPHYYKADHWQKKGYA